MRFLAVFLLVACAREAADGPPAQTPKPQLAAPPVVAPVDPPAPTIASIDAGMFHTCLARKDGRVACWGDNREGQLGDGTHVTRDVPAELDNLRAVSVVVGAAHSCARRANGEVSCWGNNKDGQLGDGTTDAHELPVAVSGLRAAVEISAGNNHTCARHSDGTVSCWGSNERGQLGDGTLDDRLRPVRVPGLADVTHVVAGAFSTCALRQSGAVSCWGDDTNGELMLPQDETIQGARSITERVGFNHGKAAGPIMRTAFLLTLPVTLPNLTAVAIDLSEHVSCAIRASGIVSCWGVNMMGLLPTKDESRTQMDIDAARGAVAIAVGNLLICARMPDATALCWGTYIDRQPTRITDRRIPPTTKLLPAKVVALTSGNMHACAVLETDGVMCWGDNQLDQLGAGATVNIELGSLAGAKGAQQVSAGYEHACALRDGKVLCWPNQDHVGHGDPPKQVPGITDATQIASGAHHDCAVLASHEIVCWGDPFAGVLGDGSTGPSKKPVFVKAITDAVEVAAGNTHTCARHASGKVSCWGNNPQGWLGTGTADPQKTPALVPGIDDAVELAVGSSHTCVRRANHTVACWGHNGGEIGDGTETERLVPTAVVGLPADVAEITAGGSHNCARTTGGTVWCWGRNDDGELGDGTKVTRTKPVQVKKLSDAIAISADGSSHTCALRKTSVVVCWGHNLARQLGNGAGPSRELPQDVATLRDVTSIGAGGLESCAIKKTGDVVCWPRLVAQDQRGMASSDAALAVKLAD